MVRHAFIPLLTGLTLMGCGAAVDADALDDTKKRAGDLTPNVTAVNFEACRAQCGSKASSCQAPKSAADTLCQAICQPGPTDAQLACLDATRCGALEPIAEDPAAFSRICPAKAENPEGNECTIDPADLSINLPYFDADLPMDIVARRTCSTGHVDNLSYLGGGELVAARWSIEETRDDFFESTMYGIALYEYDGALKTSQRNRILNATGLNPDNGTHYAFSPIDARFGRALPDGVTLAGGRLFVFGYDQPGADQRSQTDAKNVADDLLSQLQSNGFELTLTMDHDGWIEPTPTALKISYEVSATGRVSIVSTER